MHDITTSYKGVKIISLVLVSGAISYMLNTSGQAIAIASVVAFVLSMFASYIIHECLRSKEWIVRANFSNIPAAFLDTIVFTCIAFDSVPLDVFVFQFLCKAGGAVMYTFILLDVAADKKV